MKTLALALVCLLAVAVTGNAADKEVKPTQEWKGSVATDALKSLRPATGIITDKETFAKLWKEWKVGHKEPTIDFKKELVAVETTSGSKLSIAAQLTPEGDLKVNGIATADFGPGFRYQIVVLPREGVKTVNGKALPKE